MGYDGPNMNKNTFSRQQISEELQHLRLEHIAFLDSGKTIKFYPRECATFNT